MSLRVQTFSTHGAAIQRTTEIRQSSIHPERVYDPDDPNADETGHVWVVAVSADSNEQKLYLCNDGSIR